ncbi:hypothetical protein [Tahibacter soli]|uniref:Uncharacterized protein n=1 Tax=Tahibacter soli TaxID=2983605 RepID=A0A9X3YL11_9GAMM|nr:hypothetical protein [Tahibacter soli]MDC8012931.1 hypothetical protein [Tahibacter soli]
MARVELRRKLLERIAAGEKFFQLDGQTEEEQQRFDEEVECLSYLSRKGYVSGFKAQGQTTRATGVYEHAVVRGLTEEGRQALSNPPNRFSTGKIATLLLLLVTAGVGIVWGVTGDGRWEPLYALLGLVPLLGAAIYALRDRRDI